MHPSAGLAVLAVAPAFDYGDVFAELCVRLFNVIVESRDRWPLDQRVVDIDSEWLHVPPVDLDLSRRAAGDNENPTRNFDHIGTVVIL